MIKVSEDEHKNCNCVLRGSEEILMMEFGGLFKIMIDEFGIEKVTAAMLAAMAVLNDYKKVDMNSFHEMMKRLEIEEDGEV